MPEMNLEKVRKALRHVATAGEPGELDPAVGPHGGTHDTDVEIADDVVKLVDTNSPNTPDYEGLEALQEHYMQKWEKMNPDPQTRGMDMDASTMAELNWSTHKAETFKDTGEKGLHPAWGLKSIIDRGVKPHEKSDGDKRIGEADHQTTKRTIDSKSFKSYSMVQAFSWSQDG